MKRIFALALVLAMMLSMMVITASAALLPEAACSLHPDSPHWKYIEPDPSYPTMFSGTMYGVDGTRSESYAFDSGSFSIGALPTPADSGKWWCFDSEWNLQKCPGNHGSQPQPQPKTGVMDTLPVWFGVMAVSACAYVLTSKKKVF